MQQSFHIPESLLNDMEENNFDVVNCFVKFVAIRFRTVKLSIQVLLSPSHEE